MLRQSSRKWEPGFPGNGTRAEKIAYCSEKFRGWQTLGAELLEPRETTQRILYGYLAVLTPGEIMLIGEVLRWKKFNTDSVRIDFWRGGGRNVYYGKKKNDLYALTWWATEVWLQDEWKLKVTQSVPNFRKNICEDWSVMDEPKLALYPKT